MQHSPHIICNAHMHYRHVACSFVLVVILGTKCTKNKVHAWNTELCTDIAAWGSNAPQWEQARDSCTPGPGPKGDNESRVRSLLMSFLRWVPFAFHHYPSVPAFPQIVRNALPFACAGHLNNRESLIVTLGIKARSNTQEPTCSSSEESEESCDTLVVWPVVFLALIESRRRKEKAQTRKKEWTRKNP